MPPSFSPLYNNNAERILPSFYGINWQIRKIQPVLKPQKLTAGKNYLMHTDFFSLALLLPDITEGLWPTIHCSPTPGAIEMFWFHFREALMSSNIDLILWMKVFWVNIDLKHVKTNVYVLECDGSLRGWPRVFHLFFSTCFSSEMKHILVQINVHFSSCPFSLWPHLRAERFPVRP